jgi:hypothetical protein
LLGEGIWLTVDNLADPGTPVSRAATGPRRGGAAPEICLRRAGAICETFVAW